MDLAPTQSDIASPSGAPSSVEDPKAPPIPIDPKVLVAEVKADYDKWAMQRRPFEGVWFLSAAFLRGQQKVEYNDALAKLVTPSVPAHRISMSLNRIRPKIKARLAKFFHNRPRPVVIPATTERKDILNARATEKALRYVWDKHHLEGKYKEARLWATVASKGFIWLSWNDATVERIQMPGQTPGEQGKIEESAVGDVDFEVGSPFEVFVADPTKSRLGDQPRIIRARLRNVSDVQSRYPELKEIKAIGTVGQNEASARVPDRMAALNSRTGDAMGSAPPQNQHDGQTLVIEHFVAPCYKFPKGRYVVIVDDQVAKAEQELPYDLCSHSDNPYPVMEIADSLTPGQFWGPTTIEQLIDLQREYNFVRAMISENLRAMARPKIVVYKQHNLPEGAWTTSAGEILELNWIPGIPPPQIVQPANIATDCWQLLGLIKQEFDDLTQIFPSSEGKSGSTTSGFQTNLLQEAADSVHAPDIRDDEMAIEDFAWKIRRLMKLGYTPPRLISTLGANSAPEVFEFGQDQIDEYAEVRIQAGSMMPDLKSAKANVTMQLYEKGMFGNPQDPLVRRRALSLLDMGGYEVIQEDQRRDEDQAEQEQRTIQQGGQANPAQFFEDHAMHLAIHQNSLKTPEVQGLPDLVKQAIIGHIVTHYDFMNPMLGQSLRIQYNLQQIPIASPPPPPQLLAMQQGAQGGPGGAPGAPPPSSGPPPNEASPQGTLPPHVVVHHHLVPPGPGGMTPPPPGGGAPPGPPLPPGM